MADDIKIKLGLDATELFNGITKATSELNKLSTTKVDIQEGPIIADLNKIEQEAKQTGDAIDKNLGGGVESAKGKLGGLGDAFAGLGGQTGGLGNAFQSLSGGVTSLVPGLGSLSGILAGGGIAAGIAAVGGGIAYAIDKGKEFETQLASLSSITGVSGAGLDDLGQKAQAMAAKFGTEASANIDAFKTILSKLGPDIAKSPEALNSMAESVNTLSKATGDDPGKATEALTGALLQFGVSLDDPVKAADAMAVAMNVLAAGAKEGASEVPDVAAAINVAGVAASGAKVSFEETNSAIQILAAGGKVGAEAGTSLRNVLNKLGEGRFLPKDTAQELKAAGVDINKLGDTTISFSERLRELEKISGDAALKTKLFGTDAAAATILIKGAGGGMDDLTKKLTGTNTAYDQAAINMATFDESLNRIKSNVDNFAISFYQGMQMSFGMLAESIGPSVNELIENIGGYFSRMWSVVQPILAGLGALLMGAISNILTTVIETLNLFYETAVYAFDQVILAVQPLIDAIKSALGLDGAMGEGIDVVKMLQDAMNFMSAAISAVFDVLQELAKILIDILVAAFKVVISVITTVIETIVGIGKAIGDFIGWIGQLILKIPGVSSVFEGLKSAFNGVKSFFQELPKIINEPMVYLKALGSTFQAVFSVIGQAFQDALNLNFEGAAKKIASLFDTNNWSQAFAAGMENARSEVNKTTETAKKATKEFKEFQDTTTDKGGGGGGGGNNDGGGGGKGQAIAKEKASELEVLKKAFKEEQDELDRQAFYKITEAKRLGQDVKAVQERLDAEAKVKLKEFLNERLANVKDANAILTQEQITSIIKPSKKKGETVADIENFYIDEIEKLNKEGKLKVDTGISAKPPEFKDVVKEFEDLAKEIEKTSESLVPKTLATSQEALDGTIATVQQYIDFIKLQNDEIALKQAEAIAAGNQEAADKFGESILSNIQNINSLSSRLQTFGTQSKAAIEKAARESTLEFQIQTALQTSILDAFNSEKIRKEKEANDKIREERLGALNAEEDDLTKSLAKREISFEDYAAKVAEIDAQRKQVEEQTEVTFLQRLKTAGDQAAASVFKSQSEIFKKNAEGMQGNQKVFNQFVGQTLEQFGTLAASGKATLADFGNAAAGAAFDAVSKMIPSFVVGILGSSITTLGPIAGPLIAATLTAGLQLLLANARGALGFKDGVVGLEGPGDERSDSIPAWLSKGESVITAAGTRANREELEWMNKNPGMSIRDYFTSNAPQVRYSVQEDGNLIAEVRKLREETRGLGKQINRNTHVEISGALVADNNSIKAVIERDRRRNARRG
jgi:TP901 family phage tail tape measure protein